MTSGSARLRPEIPIEPWLAELISDDPALLGSGDLETRRGAPASSAWFSNPQARALYVVELQLGPADDRHLIRVVERWAAERKRHTTSRCVAVLAAEQFPPRYRHILPWIGTAIPRLQTQLQISEMAGNFAVRFTPVPPF